MESRLANRENEVWQLALVYQAGGRLSLSSGTSGARRAQGHFLNAPRPCSHPSVGGLFHKPEDSEGDLLS